MLRRTLRPEIRTRRAVHYEVPADIHRMLFDEHLITEHPNGDIALYATPRHIILSGVGVAQSTIPGVTRLIATVTVVRLPYHMLGSVRERIFANFLPAHIKTSVYYPRNVRASSQPDSNRRT